MISISIISCFIVLFFTFYQSKKSRNKKMLRRQKLQDSQDAYNKAFGIETEDKLLPFDIDEE
jgi:hypothetical protein